jgi:hypothetical protein
MSERQRYTLTLPIAHGHYAELTASWPLTYEEWHRFMAILDAMKWGLVEPPAEPEPGEGW